MSLYRSLVDRLFGYDLFISYAHADGAAYARRLADDLRRGDRSTGRKALSVFLDVDDHVHGQDLDAATVRRVRMTSMLVLVLRPVAPTRSWVQKEVQAAVGAQREVVLIDVDGTWDGLADDQVLRRLLPQNPLALRDHAPEVGSTPGAHVAETLARGFRATRREALRRRIVAAAALILLVFGLTATWQYLQAEAARLEESRARQAAERSAIEALTQSSAVLARSPGQGRAALAAGLSVIDRVRQAAATVGSTTATVTAPLGVYDALSRGIDDLERSQELPTEALLTAAVFSGDGTLWTGDTSGGLTRRGHGTQLERRWPIGRPVAAVARLPDDRVVAVTGAGTLAVAMTDEVVEYPIAPGTSLSAVSVDREGRIWIGSWDGLVSRVTLSSAGGAPAVMAVQTPVRDVAGFAAIGAYVAVLGKAVALLDPGSLRLARSWSACRPAGSSDGVVTAAPSQDGLVLVDGAGSVCRVRSPRVDVEAMPAPSGGVTILRACDVGLVAGTSDGRIWVGGASGWERLGGRLGAIETITCRGRWMLVGDAMGRAQMFTERVEGEVIPVGGAATAAVGPDGAAVVLTPEGRARLLPPREVRTMPTGTRALARMGTRRLAWNGDAILELMHRGDEVRAHPTGLMVTGERRFPPFLSSDGSLMLSQELGLGLVVSDLATGEALLRWPRRAPLFTTPVLSPDGQRVALAIDDALALYEPGKNQPRTLATDRPWLPLAFTPAGGIFAAVLAPGALATWPSDLGPPVVHEVGGALGAVEIRAQCALVATYVDDAWWLVRLDTGAIAWQARGLGFGRASVSPRCDRVAVAGEDGVVRLWRVGQDAPAVLPTGLRVATAMSWSDDAQHLIIGARVGQVIVVDVGRSTVLATWSGLGIVDGLQFDGDEVMVLANGGLAWRPATTHAIERRVRTLLGR